MPPLTILPLAAREIRTWVDGSADRVAVLHCKAGKGRSGTLACSYLLSLDDDPIPPRLERSYNAKQWARMRADQVTQVIPEDDAPPSPHPVAVADTPDHAVPPPDISSQPASAKSFTGSLKGVLDLHTSQRMKPPSSSSEKGKEGVSIPSQRRWLNYWSLLLAHEAPSHLWALPPSDTKAQPNPKVRLTEVKLRMKQVSEVKIQLDETGRVCKRQNGNGQVWVSLARYEDELVETLEKWEKDTREADQEEGHMGKRKKSLGAEQGEALAAMFEDGRWDEGKMVRSFARMGTVGSSPIANEDNEKSGSITTYTLRPLSDENWVDIRDELQQDPASRAPSAAESMYDLTETLRSEKGIVLDAGREVRVKLYMGQVFMGWFWFIPTFHMPHGPASAPTHLTLTRKEIDFPIGIGAGIVDVDVSLEWVPESDTDVVQPPAVQSVENVESEGVATAQALVTES